MAAAKECVRTRGPNKGKPKPGWRLGKGGRCIRKKKRYSRCRTKRTKARYEGVEVVLPCGVKSLSQAYKNRIDAIYTTQKWNACKRKGTKCRVIFFNKTSPVMRTEGRKLKAHACRTKKSGRFKRC